MDALLVDKPYYISSVDKKVSLFCQGLVMKMKVGF